MEYTAFISIFLVGLSFGATACMLSCMPFLSPILVNHSDSIKHSMGVMIPFSLGRIFTYTIIAVVAASSSVVVKTILKDNMLFTSILGTATIILGSFMFYNSFNTKKNCAIHKPESKKSNISKIGFFSLGATISINLCAPVLTLITLSANSTNLYSAVGLGVSFGVGAVLFTLLFYGFFLSNLIRGIMAQFAKYKKTVEQIASLFLIIVGALIINGNINL